MDKPAQLLVIVMSIVLFAAGCSKTSHSQPAVASGGAMRIVSLSPSMTESLFAVGAGEDVVGVSRYCDFPPNVVSLPKVGGFLDPSLEAILALHPSLLVGNRSPTNRGIVETIAAQGTAIYFPEDESLANIPNILAELGKRTNHAADGERVAEALRHNLASLHEGPLPAAKARVLWLMGLRPFSAAGKQTFSGEILTLISAQNVITSGPPYPTLDLEEIIRLAPEVILISDMSDDSATNVDWGPAASVPAIRNHRVYNVSDARVLRPGPRIAEGARLVAKLVYPSATQ